MPKTLTQFWSNLPISSGTLYVHPSDAQWFHDHGWDVQTQSSTSFKRFIRSDRFQQNDQELHPSLLPVPFVGNLERAKIFILLMNPGFSPANYYEEEVPAFRAACVRNLRQLNGDDEFPFFCLNPEFAWSGGFIWWEALLRPILSKLLELKKVPSYYEALAFLAKRIAAVELIPYHSAGGGALNKPGKPWKNLPSAGQARSFVQRLCEAPGQPLVLVLRKHNHWELNSHASTNCRICPALRRPTLNPDLEGENGEAGRAILQKLGTS